MRDVELPTEPHQRVALLHEESVTELGFGSRVVGALLCTIEVAKDVLSTPIENVEKGRAIAAGGVLRGQYVEVCRKSHPPGAVARGLVEIDDRLVARMRGIDREEDLAGDLFVSAGTAKCLAVQNGSA